MQKGEQRMEILHKIHAITGTIRTKLEANSQYIAQKPAASLAS